MDSLPAWACRKILDAFVRRWARAQLNRPGLPVCGNKALARATEILKHGKFSDHRRRDLQEIVEQLVFVEMSRLEESPRAWRRLLDETKSWIHVETLPSQALAYIHLAAAEEFLFEGDSVSARVLIADAPPGPHLPGESDGRSPWPEAHYLEAVERLLDRKPAEAEMLVRRAVDEALRLNRRKDMDYLRDLEELGKQISALCGAESSGAQGAGELQGELLLVVGRSKTDSTGYWELGTKRSKTRLNGIEVVTARAFVTHLRAALSANEDITADKARLDKAVQNRLKEIRDESHLRKTRQTVVKALVEAAGPGVATIPRGPRGGVVFHGQALQRSGIARIAVKQA